MKKVLSFFVILCVLVSSFVVNVSADIIANDAVETFDYTSSTAVGTARVYKEEGGNNQAVVGTNVDYTTVKTEYGSSAVFKYQASTSPTYFPNYSWSTSDGCYHISFNLYPYTTDAKRIYKQREGGGSNYYPILAFDSAGKIVYYEHLTSLQSSENNNTNITVHELGAYSANKWYNVDVYIDTVNNTYAIKVDCQDEGGVTTIGKATDVKLTGWGTGLKRMKISQYMPASGTAGDNLMALDNVKVASYNATAAGMSTNVADGATDIDVDKEFKIYAEDTITEVTAVLKQNSNVVDGAFATPVIAGNIAKLNLTSNLSANTPYSLELTVKSEAFPVSSTTKTINFTTGDGAKRKTVLDLDFEDGVLPEGLVTKFTESKEMKVVSSVVDSDYGKVLKMIPTNDINSSPADLNLASPDAVTDTKVVIEYDKAEFGTMSHVRGYAKLVQDGQNTFMHDYATSNTKVYAGGTSSELYRQTREDMGTFNNHKFVIDVDSNGTATKYSYYVNGIAKQNTTDSSVLTKDIAFTANIPASFKKLVLQLTANSSVDSSDYVIYDNLKVSYVDKVPSDFKVMIGTNAYVPGTSAALAEGDVLSVDMDNLIYPNAKVIYAFYNADGSLAKVDCENKTYTMTADDITNNYSIKVMLWKGLDNLIPLVSCVTVK